VRQSNTTFYKGECFFGRNEWTGLRPVLKTYHQGGQSKGQGPKKSERDHQTKQNADLQKEERKPKGNQPQGGKTRRSKYKTKKKFVDSRETKPDYMSKPCFQFVRPKRRLPMGREKSGKGAPLNEQH